MVKDGRVRFKSNSLKDTDTLANCLAGIADEKTVILLDGALGAGKTALTKAIAKHLGVDKGVASPTFTIVKEYEGRLKIYHADLYRISGEDFIDLGYLDEMGVTGIGIIEWGEKVVPFFSDYLYIEVDIVDEKTRLFVLSGKGENSVKQLKELEKCLS